jgi:hypothetical protein
MVHGLLGAHAAPGQGVATPLDHRISRRIGEKMRRAALGFAAADLVVMCVIYAAMVR